MLTFLIQLLVQPQHEQFATIFIIHIYYSQHAYAKDKLQKGFYSQKHYMQNIFVKFNQLKADITRDVQIFSTSSIESLNFILLFYFIVKTVFNLKYN